MATLDSSRLIGGEAVEQGVAARGPEVFLAAAPAGVRRVPRGVPAALAVMMAELSSPCIAAGPVAAGVVRAIRKSPPK